MASSQQPVNLGSQVDVTPSYVNQTAGGNPNELVLRLLQEILKTQKQHLELTREMVAVSRESRTRQHAELEAWQDEHLGIVERCRDAMTTLSSVHAGTLGDMADFIEENQENLLESDFSLSEFVDKFGPRLHHLSAMLSVFKQLAGQVPREAAKAKKQTR